MPRFTTNCVTLSSCLDEAEFPNGLARQAQEFADNLTRTIRTVTPRCDGFEATHSNNRLVVRQRPDKGIVLTFDGQPLLVLKAEFYCEWNRENQFLAVQSSTIKVLTSASTQPLFRYEYLRAPNNVPSAHLHVHAHRDAMTYVMTKVGRTTQRPQRRGGKDGIPALQDLHFPLGGHRFRPALEDILEMLIDEFDIDHERGARDVLAEARAAWRMTQTKAAVRDAPGAAVDALAALGYRITPPDSAATTRHEDRLRSL